jgi:hypothetical protein
MTTPIYPVYTPSSIGKETPHKIKPARPTTSDALYPAPPAPVKFAITKPKLSPPSGRIVSGKSSESGNIVYSLLHSLSNLWEVGNDRLRLHLGLLDKHNKEIDELSLEHTQKIKETAQKTQNGKFWSLLQKIGSVILAAFSIFCSTTVASPLIGGLLIASGVLAIANIALSEAGLWDNFADKLFPDDQERRKKFIALVPAAIGIVSGVCGAAGGIAAFLTTGAKFATGALAIANIAVNLAEGVTAIGAGIHQGSVLFSEAEVKRLDKAMFIQQNQLEKVTGGFEDVIKLLSQSYAKASRIISMSIRAGEEITLQA